MSWKFQGSQLRLRAIVVGLLLRVLVGVEPAKSLRSQDYPLTTVQHEAGSPGCYRVHCWVCGWYFCHRNTGRLSLPGPLRGYDCPLGHESGRLMAINADSESAVRSVGRGYKVFSSPWALYLMELMSGSQPRKAIPATVKQGCFMFTSRTIISEHATGVQACLLNRVLLDLGFPSLFTT